MIIVNFSHPLSDAQKTEIERIQPHSIDRVIDIPTNFDNNLPFGEQAVSLARAVPLSAREWQTERILLLLPEQSAIAALMLAILHGYRGDFPTIIRRRRETGEVATVYEIAEIINLQEVRETARPNRYTGASATEMAAGDQ
jgi:hypothetical protein